MYEKGIVCDTEIINVLNDEERAHFATLVNPLAKIPFLVTDDGTRIPESAIIAEYLDRKFPTGPRLVPEDPDRAIQMRLVERVADLYLIHKLGQIFFDSRRPPALRHPEATQHAHHQLQLGLHYLNEVIGDRPFAVGNSFTLADVTLSVALALAQVIRVDLAPHPNLVRWSTSIFERSSWSRVRREAMPFVKALAPPR